MKQGKHICETLKAIRRDIASANEIEYNPTECTHQGDCAGTCPKCEQETQWLERQLRNCQALGKAVTIAGLSVALGAMSSCHKIFQPDGMIMLPTDNPQTNLVNNVKNDSINTTVVNVADNDSTENIDMQLMGDVVAAPKNDNPEQPNNNTTKQTTTKKSSIKKKSSKKK